MSILLRITGMAWRYPARVVLAYLSFFVAVAFSLLVPHLFGEAIDKLVRFEGEAIAVANVPTQTLFWMALAILGASLARGIFDFGRTYTSDSLSQKVAFDVRNSVYDKLQHLSFGYHDKEHTGDLMSKVTADVEAVRRYVSFGLVRSLEVAVRIVAITAILVTLNWQLTLLSLAFVPFMVARSTMVVRRLRAMWLHVQEILGQLVTVLQENLVGIHVVKAFASEEHEKKKYDAKAQELRREYVATDQLDGTNSAWMTLYFTVALGLILWYGGWEVIRGDLTPGGLTKFILYLNQLSFPVRISAYILNNYSRAISSGKRVFEVLDARSPVTEKPGAKQMARPKGHVRFEDVSFSYDSKLPALEHLGFVAVPGQVTAILGAPGCGKSTIANLLPRFYDVTGGRITIDGHDIRDYTLASLRRNIGIVQQDVFLFSASIQENIAYGAVNASKEDIENAAKVAQLHDHIMGLPNGYDTLVGERGTTLSGGQRQRLAIARTVLVDPPVLILDDSTSSVDVETERSIHRAMAEVTKGRTTFVIAHRLSTVQDADLIIVLKEGRIVERGSHSELMALGRTYREIYDLQLRPQAEVMLDAAVRADVGGES